MLFLQALATGWSAKLKAGLNSMVSNTDLWVRNTLPSQQAMDKRDYYLDAPRTRVDQPPPPPPSHDLIEPPPPPPPELIPEIFIPPPPNVICPPPPPPPPPGWKPKAKKKAKRYGVPYRSYGPNLNSERCNTYMRQFFLSRLPDQEAYTPESTTPMEVQAEMIKHLVTEAKIRKALDGEVGGQFFNIKSFASSMPHQTILTVLEFIGMPQTWLDIFTRFLRAPLNMGPVIRGTADQVVTRTNGVPIAHGMEILLGELILFFFDLAAHQKTGSYLYRIRDQCYFIGSADHIEKLVLEFMSFSDSMQFSNIWMPEDPSGTLPIGLLNLSFPAGQQVNITVDSNKVNAYGQQAKKQLAACTTVISWVRVWNATVGNYAPHLFGPLANVFGKPHLEAVIQAYNRIHEIIFGEDNLTEHMKKLLYPFLQKNALEVSSFALEPLIFLPTAYGGLGVKNPYIALNLAGELPKIPMPS